MSHARHPLSFAQRRLWFLQEADPGSPAYNVVLVFQIRGALDRAALSASLLDVIERHEALRLEFVGSGPDVEQAAAPSRDEPPLEIIEVPWAALDAATRRVSSRPFDLQTEAPVRAALLVAGEAEHRFVLVLHHIVMDIGSRGPLLRDLAAAYTARCDGVSPRFEPIEARYEDYVEWQRRMLGDPADEQSRAGEQLAFWRRTLAGLPEELALPYDRPRSDDARHEVGRVEFDVSAETHAKLLALARATRSSPFMVGHAALAACLCCIGAGTDIPIGTPFAGRMEDFQGVVGLFINSLVLRIDLSDDPTFEEAIRRARPRGRAQPAVPNHVYVAECVIR
ncbi:MAG: hypothetical protein AUG48_03455 [Actinobacteria bacterium 13_1_20CM_3_68_9]|nr:MAG: hypothetical protein AUG48_03455 [Actinobacteria bacterium 13_1_20CM_3_68_9]